MSIKRLSWAQFEVANSDKEVAFEDLCRSLFNKMYFDGKANFHSNTNNPGIEIEPCFSAITNNRISYQSKYFSNRVRYDEIENSAEKTVKNYKGKIDTLYLFCNLDINTNTKGFSKVKELLDDANIQIVLMCNKAILDKVIDYQTLSEAYFDDQRLTIEYLTKKFNEQTKIINPRYNPEFNVETDAENKLNLFALTPRALEFVNSKKQHAVEYIKTNMWYSGKLKKLVEKMHSFIENIPFVGCNNICDALEWEDIFCKEFSEELKNIQNELNKKESDRRKSLEINKYEEGTHLYYQIKELKEVLSVSEKLSFTRLESNLIKKRFLIVKGKAGMGKTQLFATTVDGILQNKLPSLLLLGTTLLSNERFEKQIMDSLGLNYSFDEFLDLLEEIGERYGCVVTLFIDAINESNKEQRWDTFIIEMINKLETRMHLKVAVSMRTEYEEMLLKDTLDTYFKNETILKISHTGFANNSIESIKQFLNYYDIPFSPVDYMQYEMTNPLFLTMFCKSYANSVQFNIMSLFDTFVKIADKEIQERLNLQINNLLPSFLNECVEWQLKNKKQSIPREAILKFSFWENYGVKKLEFLSVVVQSGVMITFPINNDEIYTISYNLLENFLSARFIVRKYRKKEELISYLEEDFLEISKGGIVKNYHGLETIGIICGLYAEQIGEELTEIIDKISKYPDVVRNYIYSFSWRKSNSISSKYFFDFAKKHSEQEDAFWETLITNSMKIEHPLNADALHTFLFDYSLAERDASWTIFINSLSSEEYRIFQIIEFYEKGGTFKGVNKGTLKKCLILMSWILSSSNRALRDHTSRAMIAILKDNFELCEELLKAFSSVNDPYIIQRLYGIVFGACIRRTTENKEIYINLAKYVYKTVFDKENVVPDILLRDYAKLIVERAVFEYGVWEECDLKRIYPPYNSDDIPLVNQENYKNENSLKSGYARINHSMMPNCTGASCVYGDFGRYTFEATLDDFENVNVLNLYHFAMQYIRDELGYDDDLFGAYDCSSIVRFDRGYEGSIERIGKKYQWIAFHHILARVSDNHKMKNWEGEPKPYSSPCDMFIRDFDPTINVVDEKENLPKIEWYTSNMVKDFISSTSSEEVVLKWAGSNCLFFSEHEQRLLVIDEHQNEWFLLYDHDEINYKNSVLSDWLYERHSGNQTIWSISQAYFVKNDDWENLKPKLKDVNFYGRWFPDPNEESFLYNGEYPWASSCHREELKEWKECILKTGTTHIETQKTPYIDGYESTDDGYKINFRERTEKVVIEDEEKVCEVMPAFMFTSWSAENDYSKDESISVDFPCAELMEYFQLSSKQKSGVYKNPDGEIICFDASNGDRKDRGIVIRKDFLMRFLKEKKYTLFWTCFGEKQFFGARQTWGEWSGFFYLENGSIKGKYKNKTTNS